LPHCRKYGIICVLEKAYRENTSGGGRIVPHKNDWPDGVGIHAHVSGGLLGIEAARE
jgi:hypothetical protein